MVQKNASPHKRQWEILKANGKDPLEWVVVKELQNVMFIRHRSNGQFEVIRKWVQ